MPGLGGETPSIVCRTIAIRSLKIKPARYFLILPLAMAGLAFAIMPIPGTIPVLMYHFIGTKADASREGNYVSKESFERQMGFLAFFKYS